MQREWTLDMVGIMQALASRQGIFPAPSCFKMGALLHLCANGCVVINRKGACLTRYGWEIVPLCDMVPLVSAFAGASV